MPLRGRAVAAPQRVQATSPRERCTGKTEYGQHGCLPSLLSTLPAARHYQELANLIPAVDGELRLEEAEVPGPSLVDVSQRTAADVNSPWQASTAASGTNGSCSMLYARTEPAWSVKRRRSMSFSSATRSTFVRVNDRKNGMTRVARRRRRPTRQMRRVGCPSCRGRRRDRAAITGVRRPVRSCCRAEIFGGHAQGPLSFEA
jgi:hypothetical protein